MPPIDFIALLTRKSTLPLYVQDWIDCVTMPEGGSLGNFPVHRFDGDGWYIYIPISPWSRVISDDFREGKHWEWTSDYGTGSSLTINRFSQSLEDEYTVSRKQGYIAWMNPNRCGSGTQTASPATTISLQRLTAAAGGWRSPGWTQTSATIPTLP